MNNRFQTGFGLVLLSMVSASALAHHGSRQHFDYGDEYELEAVVTEFKMVNPHSTIYFEVVGESGEVEEWRCEMPPASPLKRLGWTKESLYPGQKVTVIGIPAKREERFCKANEFVLEDGSRLSYDLTRGFAAELATEEQVNSRPTRLANGQPNISGSWSPPLGFGTPPETRESFRDADGGPGKNGAPVDLLRANTRPVPTEAGLSAAEGYDPIYDDPVLSCNSLNIIYDWVDEVNNVAQYDDRVEIKYGYMDLRRTIWLNETEHPENIEPSVAGHSIGHWEDDVLVVDTIGFKPGVLLSGARIMHSGEMHVTERFDMTEEGKLRRSYVVEDPLFLEGTLAGENVMDLSVDPSPDYNCLALEGKNNQRPSEQEEG